MPHGPADKNEGIGQAENAGEACPYQHAFPANVRNTAHEKESSKLSV
jgi:hypothetical protein